MANLPDTIIEVTKGKKLTREEIHAACKKKIKGVTYPQISKAITYCVGRGLCSKKMDGDKELISIPKKGTKAIAEKPESNTEAIGRYLENHIGEVMAIKDVSIALGGTVADANISYAVGKYKKMGLLESQPGSKFIVLDSIRDRGEAGARRGRGLPAIGSAEYTRGATASDILNNINAIVRDNQRLHAENAKLREALQAVHGQLDTLVALKRLVTKAL